MKCLVPGCRGKPVFKIPSNKCLREKWQNDFPFNITLIDNNLVGICVEHFKQDDIIYENNSKDQFGKELYHTCLKTVRLKDEAIPAIFPKQTPLINLMRTRPIVKGPAIHPELIKVLESNNLNCLSDGQSDIDTKDIKKITRYDLWKYTDGKDPVLQVLPPLVAIKGKNPAAEQKKLTEVSPKPVEKKPKENSPQKNPAAEHKKLIEVSPKPVKKRPKEYSPRIIKFYHPWTKQTVVLEKVKPPINISTRPVGSKRKQILIPVKDGSESEADKVQVVTPVVPGSSPQSDKDTCENPKIPLKINPKANQSIKSVEPNSNIAKDGSESKADKVQVVTPVLPRSSSQRDKHTHGKRKRPLIINPKANQIIKSVELISNIAKDGSKSEADKVQVVTPILSGSSPQSDKDTHGKEKISLIINPKANQSIKSVEPNSNMSKDGNESKADKVQVVTPVLPASSSQSDQDTKGNTKRPLKINPTANQSIKSLEPNSNIAKDGSESKADKVQVVTPILPGSSSQSDKDTHGKRKRPLIINPKANQFIKSVEPNSNIAKDGSKKEAEKVKVVTFLLPVPSSQSDKDTKGNPKGPLKINPTANQSIKSVEPNANIAKDGSKSEADKVQVVTPVLPRSSSQSDKHTDGNPKKPLKINPTANQSIKPAELNSNIAKDGSKKEAEKVKVVTSVLPGSSSQSDKHTYGNPKGPLKINPTANQSIKSVEPNSNIAKIGSEIKADNFKVLTYLVPSPSSQSDKNAFGSPKRLRQIYPKANQSIKSVKPNSNIAKDGSKGELDKVVLEPATLPGCLSQGNKQIFETQKCLNEPVKIPKILSTKTNLSSNPVDPTCNIDGHKKAMPPNIGTQHIIVNNTIPETLIKVILQNNNPQIKFDNKNISVQLTNSKTPNDHHMLIKGNTTFGDKPPMYLIPGLLGIPGPQPMGQPMGITLPLAFVNSSPTVPVTPSVPARQNFKVVTTTSSTQTKSKAISCEIGKPESAFTSSPGKSKSEEVVVACCPEDFLGSFSGRSSLEDEQIIENPKTPIEQEKMTPKKTKEPSGIVESDSLINIRKGLIPKMGEVTLNSGQRLKKKVCVIPAKDVLSRNLSKKMIQKLISDQFGVKASYGSKLFNVIANNLKRFKTNYQKQIHRGSTNKLGSNIVINSMRKVGTKEMKKSLNPLKTTENRCSAGEEVGLNTPVEYFQSNILDIVSQDMNKKRLKNSDKLGGKRKRLKQSLPSKFRLTFSEKFKNGSSEQTKNIFNIPTKITNINDKLQMEVLCQTLIEALHRFQDTEVDGNVEMNLVVSIIKENDIKSDELNFSEKNITNMGISDIVSLENTTSKKQVDCSGIQNTSNLCSNVTSELEFSHADKQPVKSVVCKESGMTVKIVSEKQNNPGSDDTEMQSSSSYNNIGQTVNASLDHSYSPVTHFAFRNPRYLVKVIENNSKGKQLLKRKVIVRPPPKRLIQKYEKEKLKLQKRICKLSVKIKSKNFHISEKNKKIKYLSSIVCEQKGVKRIRYPKTLDDKKCSMEDTKESNISQQIDNFIVTEENPQFVQLNEYIVEQEAAIDIIEAGCTEEMFDRRFSQLYKKLAESATSEY